MENSTRTTILIRFTLDTARPEPEDGDEQHTPESALLYGLDQAYNFGHLPSDATWYPPIACDLPDGWKWHSRGAWLTEGSGAVPEVVVVDGDVAFIGCKSAPPQVVAAVMARFIWAGGEQ